MALSVKRNSFQAIPLLQRGYLFAVMAVLALATAAGFWCWSSATRASHLTLAASVELNYRPDLPGILCEEAAANDLKIMMWSPPRTTGDRASSGRPPRWIPSLDAIEGVDSGKLDAAVVPAGLFDLSQTPVERRPGRMDAAEVPAGLPVQKPNVRQVALLDCEAVHLFVRPEVCAQGVAGLWGKRLYLGAEGSGARVIAREILKFIKLAPGRDFQDIDFAFGNLRNLPRDALPDGIFSLSPLPSPLGERLVQFGYQLMELPCGEALALRHPYLEDTCIPANTYGVHPPVPEKRLHTVGTRAVLIANANVPTLTVRRLLKVLYESDFTRRVGIEPLDASLLSRSGEYPNHAGTTAYLHRHDPWINKDLIDTFVNLRGAILSVASAVFLAWQWYRRRRVAGVDDHLRACNELDLNALRAASRGTFDDADLQSCLDRLAELKVNVLEQHNAGMFAEDRQFLDLVARIESLQQSLPDLAARIARRDEATLPARPPRRKIA
jgi:hypothetical protein